MAYLTIVVVLWYCVVAKSVVPYGTILCAVLCSAKVFGVPKPVAYYCFKSYVYHSAWYSVLCSITRCYNIADTFQLKSLLDCIMLRCLVSYIFVIWATAGIENRQRFAHRRFLCVPSMSSVCRGNNMSCYVLQGKIPPSSCSLRRIIDAGGISLAWVYRYLIR